MPLSSNPPEPSVLADGSPHAPVTGPDADRAGKDARPDQTPGMGLLVWVLLAALSVLWGGSFLFGKIAVSSMPPFSIVAVRVVLASLTLAAILAVLGMALPKGRALWGTLLGMGLLNNAIPFSLIMWGQTELGAGLASIINAMTPLFTLLVAHGLTKDERLTGPKIAGVVLGIAGVAVLLNPQSRDGHSLAILSCLGATLSYAFANVWGRRFKAFAIAPIQMAFGQVTMSSLVMVPLAVLVDQPWTRPLPDPQALASLMVLGVFCTGLAYILFFEVLSRAGATAASLVTFMIPPSAIVMGAWVLGESLTAMQYAGMALIGAGLAAVDGRLLHALKRGAASGAPRP